MRLAVMNRSSLHNLAEYNAAIRGLTAAGFGAAEARAILAVIAHGHDTRHAALPTKIEMREEFATVSRIVANHVAARDRLLIRWLIAGHLLLLAIMIGIARFTDIF